ncbi:MAG: hypothetical protein JSR45_05710 [Proteobacteria bacterium]|nr:hypothetical protein [Pseudomonadota bacterium]
MAVFFDMFWAVIGAVVASILAQFGIGVDSTEDRAAATPVHRTAHPPASSPSTPSGAKRAEAGYVVVRLHAAPQAEQKGA